MTIEVRWPALEDDVKMLRGELAGITEELLRRKEAALAAVGDKHKGKLLLAAAGLLTLGGGLLGAHLWNRRHAPRSFLRARAWRAALARAVAHPERIAPDEPGLARRALTSVGLQVVLAAVTAVVERRSPPPRS